MPYGTKTTRTKKLKGPRQNFYVTCLLRYSKLNLLSAIGENWPVMPKACQACVQLRMILSKIPFYHKSDVYNLIFSSPNLIENDHISCFFDYKIPTQQHFEPRFEKMPKS